FTFATYSSGTGAAGTGGVGASGTGGAAGTPALAGAGGATPAAGSGGAAPTTPSIMLRREGNPDITCQGGTGMSIHTRSSPDARVSWSIGGGDRSDVVGHVVVVHDGAARIACGKITAQ